SRPSRTNCVAGIRQPRPLQSRTHHLGTRKTVQGSISASPADSAILTIQRTFRIVEPVVNQQIALRRLRLALHMPLRHDRSFPTANVVDIGGPAIERVQAESGKRLLSLSIAVAILIVEQKAVQPDMASSSTQFDGTERR